MAKQRTYMNGHHGKYMVVLYTKPCDCGGNCLYCIKESKVTRSTVPNQDTLLARDTNWSSSAQLLERCKKEGVILNTGNKFELRIKGNSFTNYEPEYLENYIKEIYDLLNGFVGKTFEESFIAQRNAKDKVVQIVIETRPDQITDEWCLRMRRWGVTTVEIGVQSLNDDVLRYINRGHLTDVVINASRLIRKYGFELTYQLMLNLPSSNFDIDRKMLLEDLYRSEYYPDNIKVYPCLLLPNREAQKPLYALFDNKTWVPMNNDVYHQFLLTVLPYLPKDIHVNRLQRIFREDEVAYGPKVVIDRKIYRNISHTMWQRSFQNNDLEIKDIKSWDIEIYNHDNHYTVLCVCNDVILGYGRVSIFDREAIIRDVRVLGDPLEIGRRDDKNYLEHRGIGKLIIKNFEDIAKKNNCSRVIVNSSAGCVTYFEKIGYKSENYYKMVKDI